ncbi:Leucine Rich Repeat [Seminavis robusta]|uniref:Leucine Rich Repeat n=1 Tax=Seminavis robusta TaxID=568900 RepID=A0A9N8DUF2_9STRA|nr:Leucine Rich Repeat [Seminavis robusta]|eukprot:Sro283_g107810.1 Leucine Rich Repeat (464) ;mRNA; f:64088-65479
MKGEKDVLDVLDVVAARLNHHSNHSSIATIGMRLINGMSADLEGKDMEVEAQRSKPLIGDITTSDNDHSNSVSTNGRITSADLDGKAQTTKPLIGDITAGDNINPRDQCVLGDTGTEAMVRPVNSQLERAVVVQLESLPGAYAVAPTPTGIPAEVDTNRDVLIQQTSGSSHTVALDEDPTAVDVPNHNHDHDLAVANMVPEDTLQSTVDLPQAQGFDAVESDRRRARRAKQFQTKVFSVSCFVLIVIVVILVAVVLTRSKEVELPSDDLDLEENDLEPATEIPSPAPTTLRSNILALLPQDTITILKEDPKSPQSKALEWLLEDVQYLAHYEDQRIVQKFALVTLFYATDGHRWTTNTSWLSHHVHECNWFKHQSFSLRDFRSKFFPGYFKEFKNISGAPSCHNDTGLYQHLWLDQNNLVGSIPEELFLLTSLKTLSIGRNRIEGTISTRVGQLVVPPSRIGH